MKIFTNIFFLVGVMVVLANGNIYAQESSISYNPLSEISGGLSAPLRIAVDQEGTSYVTDAFNKSISKYSTSGTFEGFIEAVALPISVAVNSDGELYIGDAATGHIFKYNETQGATLFYSGSEYPTSMEFSPDNVLYISDSKLQQVVVIDLSGNLIQTIGSGTLDFPTGIALDNNNKRILVGEHGGKGTGFSPVVKVWMFDFQGNLITSFGRYGNTGGRFYRVQGLAVGKCGDIYVVDPYLARISVFDENGIFKTTFGDWGEQPGQLDIPLDIVFDAQERIHITSMNNSKLELYSTSSTLPCSNMNGNAMICAGESTDIEIGFEGTAPWTFTYATNGIDTETITTSENPYILAVYDSGHYEVTALSDANYTGNCFTGSADVQVSPDPPTSEMTGDAIICNGHTAEISIAFTGSSPWTFTYTINGENPTNVTTTNNPHSLEVSGEGYYEITNLSGGACTGSSMLGSAEIIINDLPTATITEGNGQIPIVLGGTANLTISLTGISPWEITYTVDDTNPVTISNITESPYILQVSEIGSYEITEVSDANCTNNTSIGFPEVVIVPSPPVAINDFIETPNITSVEMYVLSNDYDLDGEIDPETVTIVDNNVSGDLEVQPNGSIIYTPAQEFCGEETFTYNVADNSGLISNLATVTITVTDHTPPVFTDVPEDTLVSCYEVPDPATLSAQDNCDSAASIYYLGETIIDDCDSGYYTLTRTWEAVDNNDNSAIYTQYITVETYFTAGCYTLNLVSVEYSITENKTVFAWELNANGCEKTLKYIAFQIPDYMIAQEPLDNSTYSYPENSFDYKVENPYGSVNNENYSIRFKSQGGGLSDGGPEIFVYSLPGEINMNDVRVEVKSGNNAYFVTIPTLYCACSNYMSEKSQELMADRQDYELRIIAYPNPFTDQLFFEFQSPIDTHGRLEVYDMMGSKIKSLFDGNISGGQNYKVEYRPTNITTGMIFYRMLIDGKIISGKVIYRGK